MELLRKKNQQQRSQEWECNLPHQIWAQTNTELCHYPFRTRNKPVMIILDMILCVCVCAWSWINHDLSKEIKEIFACLFFRVFCVHEYFLRHITNAFIHQLSPRLFTLYSVFFDWRLQILREKKKPPTILKMTFVPTETITTTKNDSKYGTQKTECLVNVCVCVPVSSIRRYEEPCTHWLTD